ncbi:unnamed protein product, partial [Pocillopora meandrina]
TKQQCRTRQRVQSYCGFALFQRSVRTASTLPTRTRRTRCFHVGGDAKISRLVRPKDAVDLAKQDGVVYRIPCECGKVYIGETGRPMQDRIKEHDRDIRLARTETSAVSEHAHNTGHKPLWNEVKFIDRDPYYYTHRVKEAINIRLHPNNIVDSGIEISEASKHTIKKDTTTGEPCDSGPPREQIIE